MTREPVQITARGKRLVAFSSVEGQVGKRNEQADRASEI